MKNLLLKSLFLVLATTAIFAFAAPQTTAAFFNPGDHIWDANANVGGVILKAKYKESPDNGLMDQSFEAEVKNIGPGQLVFFSANGYVLGSAVADSFGTATFAMTLFGLPNDGTGRVDGPRAETGDMVRAFRGNSFIEAPLVKRP